MYGVTVSNAAYWALHFIGCYDVAIENISLYNEIVLTYVFGIIPSLGTWAGDVGQAISSEPGVKLKYLA